MSTPQSPDWATLTHHPMTAAHDAIVQLFIELYDALDPAPTRLAEDVMSRIARESCPSALARRPPTPAGGRRRIGRHDPDARQAAAHVGSPALTPSPTALPPHLAITKHPAKKEQK